MVLKKFGLFSAIDTDLDTLPWANVFAKSVTDYEEVYFVTGIKPFDTGLMVMTGYFKGYIHKGTKIHDYLLEALAVWVKLDYDSVDTLLVQVNRKGKLTLVQDDESKSHMWHDSDGMYSQFAGKILQMEEEESNPFLAGMGLHVLRESKSDVEDTSSSEKSQLPASRRGRKGG